MSPRSDPARPSTTCEQLVLGMSYAPSGLIDSHRPLRAAIDPGTVLG